MFKKKYEIVEIWECEWDKLIKDNSFVREFVKNQDIKAPIEARDALFGGRTNAFKLFHTKKEDETIKYYDITSLYPFVQKYKRYPINHPKIISDNFQTIEHYFGLAKIRISPPKKLNIPILPMKINGKLIFTLCCKCAEENNKLCVHNDNERCLEGTWCTPEILKAIEYHYKIFKIYEVWHFENTDCFNKDTKSGGIFTEYIHTFLKMKQEASGFPSNVKSTEEQNIYIKEYFENEDILLESSNIVKNPGIRKVSKIMLNSEFKKGLDEIDDLNNFQENLLIFDDLMNECQNDKDILHLFTRGSHHKNISTILLTQNLFNNGKYSRTMSLNCHYLIIFNNPRDKSQISYLSQEMFPLNSKFLIEAYEDATSKPYGYILIDNTQICDENLRIKTNITGKNIIYIRK